MGRLIAFLRSEPVAVAAFCAAVLGLLVTLHVVGPSDVNPILGVVGSILALVTGGIVRSVVTPTSSSG